MGAALETPNGAAGRGRRRRRAKPMSEINVTPLVDVMLVLLIVFMVAAPLLTVGVKIDLPETAARQIDSQTEPLTVTVTSDGQIYLQDAEVPLDELVDRLTAVAAQGIDERIFVRGDRDVDYGTIMQVMGRLNAAGFRRLALVTDQEMGG